MSDDPVNQATIDLIKRNEGCVLTAYPDPATGGDPWTIGFGHTGDDVSPGMVITDEQAEALLVKDLDKFETGVADLLDPNVTTSDNQYGAMVSLAYNVGLGNFEKSSVLRLHNTGDFAAAADAFLLWNKAAGRVMAGLDRRRHEERTFYLTP
jgi:lysozyme